MVDVSDMLKMSYYELAPYTGSDGDKRFRIEKITEGEGEEQKKLLQVSMWWGKYSYDNTPKEAMIIHTEDFGDEGLKKIADWLNDQEG